MLNMHTNLQSFVLQKSIRNSDNLLSQAVERMYKGFQVNNQENPAGYSMDKIVEVQLNSLDIAEDNATAGLDLVLKADEILDVINAKFTRLRDLAMQAQNPTYGTEDCKAINIECQQLVKEIQGLYTEAEYNGMKIFGMEALETIPVGATEPNAVTDPIMPVATTTYATALTKLQELGINESSFQIYNAKGEVVESYDTEKNDTLQDVFDVLVTHGFTASINEGIISLSTTNGLYVDGDLFQALGVELDSTDYVESTTQSSDRVYYTATFTASEGSTLNDLGVLTSGTDTIVVKDRYGDVCANIVVDSATTLGEIFSTLENYDITSTIEDGIITFNSPKGSYLASQGVIASLGINLEQSSSIVTEGTTQTSAGPIIYESIIAQDEMIVTIKEEQTVTVWSTTTTSRTVTETVWVTTTSSLTRTDTIMVTTTTSETGTFTIYETTTVQEVLTNTIYTTTTSKQTITETIWTTTTHSTTQTNTVWVTTTTETTQTNTVWTTTTTETTQTNTIWVTTTVQETQIETIWATTTSSETILHTVWVTTTTSVTQTETFYTTQTVQQTITETYWITQTTSTTSTETVWVTNVVEDTVTHTIWTTTTASETIRNTVWVTTTSSTTTLETVWAVKTTQTIYTTNVTKATVVTTVYTTTTTGGTQSGTTQTVTCTIYTDETFAEILGADVFASGERYCYIKEQTIDNTTGRRIATITVTASMTFDEFLSEVGNYMCVNTTFEMISFYDDNFYSDSQCCYLEGDIATLLGIDAEVISGNYIELDYEGTLDDPISSIRGEYNKVIYTDKMTYSYGSPTINQLKQALERDAMQLVLADGKIKIYMLDTQNEFVYNTWMCLWTEDDIKTLSLSPYKRNNSLDRVVTRTTVITGSTTVTTTTVTQTVEVTTTSQTTQSSTIYVTGTCNETEGTTLTTVTSTSTSTEPIVVTITVTGSTSNFIQEITQRDTSTMTALSSMAFNKTLASGTYKISTSDDLQQLAILTNEGNLSSSNTYEFVLANDIDLSSISNWKPIGNISNSFYGTFDGNGHIIKNMKIDSLADYQGLFGYAEGEIRNIGLENCDVRGSNNVGGLAGAAGYIHNSYVTGNVAGNNGVGVLAGYVNEDLRYCHATGTVIGTDTVGGLVGMSMSIWDSYTNVNVTGNNGVGGLVGEGTLYNCYSMGSVKGNSNVGGLIGFAYCSAQNSYSLCNVTGFGGIFNSSDWDGTKFTYGGTIYTVTTTGSNTIYSTVVTSTTKDINVNKVNTLSSSTTKTEKIVQTETIWITTTSSTTYTENIYSTVSQQVTQTSTIYTTTTSEQTRTNTVMVTTTAGTTVTHTIFATTTVKETQAETIWVTTTNASTQTSEVWVTKTVEQTVTETLYTTTTTSETFTGVVYETTTTQEVRTETIYTDTTTTKTTETETIYTTRTFARTETETVWNTNTTSTTFVGTMYTTVTTETTTTQTFYTTVTAENTRTNTIFETTTIENTKTLVFDTLETIAASITTSNVSMTSDTTFNDLGLTNTAYITVMNDETALTITVEATDTVGSLVTKLNRLGLVSKIDDAKLTITPNEKSIYISGMSSDLRDALSFSNHFYNTSLGVDMTDSNMLIYDDLTTMSVTTTLLDLGITTGELVIKKDGESTATIVVSETQTVGDLLKQLREQGFTADCVDGVLMLNAKGDKYLASSDTNSSNAITALPLDNIYQNMEQTYSNTDSDQLEKLTEIVQKVWQESTEITIQVGIDSSEYSRLDINTGLIINNIESFRNVGKNVLNKDRYVTDLNNILDTIYTKQLEFNGKEAQLMSILDTISIQYDNMLDLKETLRDNGGQTVTSEYIMHQIMHNASQTLLAVANQNPQLALQLL